MDDENHTVQTIYLCNLGWRVLYKKLASEIRCKDLTATVGKYKVGYRMYTLGAILLHEILSVLLEHGIMAVLTQIPPGIFTTCQLWRGHIKGELQNDSH